MLIYDLSIRSLVTESGIPDTRKPSLVFGDRPTWEIRVMEAGEPADLSGVMAWTAAVADDLNPGTRPMCRTTSGISEEEGVVSVPLDTQTDTFAGATANRGPRVCLFELCGLDGDGGVVLRVAFHAVCRMEADPGAVGDLVPIEVTEMTSAQVQAIATGAAREEVAEIQQEIEQAKTDAEEAKRNQTDRIEVERFFSTDKRYCGAGLIVTKLADTTLASIALSLFVANLFGTSAGSFFVLYLLDAGKPSEEPFFIEFSDAADEEAPRD